MRLHREKGGFHLQSEKTEELGPIIPKPPKGWTQQPPTAVEREAAAQMKERSGIIYPKQPNDTNIPGADNTAAVEAYRTASTYDLSRNQIRHTQSSPEVTLNVPGATHPEAFAAHKARQQELALAIDLSTHSIEDWLDDPQDPTLTENSIDMLGDQKPGLADSISSVDFGGSPNISAKDTDRFCKDLLDDQKPESTPRWKITVSE